MNTYLRPRSSEALARTLAGPGRSSSEQLVLLFEVVAELTESGRDRVNSIGHSLETDWPGEVEDLLARLAEQSGLADTEAFVASWQALLRGVLLGLRCGDRAVVSCARRAAEVALHGWPRR